jgi:hypothetical protein
MNKAISKKKFKKTVFQMISNRLPLVNQFQLRIKLKAKNLIERKNKWKN